MTIGFTRLAWARCTELPTDELTPRLSRVQGPARVVHALLWRCGLCQQVTANPVLHRGAHALAGIDLWRSRLLTVIYPCSGCMGTGSEGYTPFDDDASRCTLCLGTGRVALTAHPARMRLVQAFEQRGVLA